MKRLRFRPSKRALYTLIGLSVLAFFIRFIFGIEAPDITQTSWWTLVLVFVLCLFWDWRLSLRVLPVDIQREVVHNLSVTEWHPVKLTLQNRGRKPLQMMLDEHCSETTQTQGMPRSVELGSNQTTTIEYLIQPHRRGEEQILGSEMRVSSPLGLWETNWFIDNMTEIKVFPDFKRISDLSGLKGSVDITMSGLKKFNRRGEGMEFHQLREYRQGDSLRQVDWKASSRTRKLISREYQEEKNQNIAILLDAGKRMRIKDDDLSHFDHALNALIMLSYITLKNGDVFSSMSFNQQLRWLPHIKGSQNVTRVLNHFYDLYADTYASDYLVAAQEFMEKHPKRALVLLVTTLKDEDFEDLRPAIHLLKQKHLVAIINIEDTAIETAKKQDVLNFEDSLIHSVAEKIDLVTQRQLRHFQQEGVICVHCSAKNLTSSVINSYLEVKRAGLL